MRRIVIAAVGRDQTVKQSNRKDDGQGHTMAHTRNLTLIGAIVIAGLWSSAGAMAQSYQASPYPYVTLPPAGDVGDAPYIGGRRSRTVTTQYYVYPAPAAPTYRPRSHKSSAVIDLQPARSHKSSAVIDVQSKRRTKPYAQETQETQEPAEPPTASVAPRDHGKGANNRVIRAEAEVHILGPDKMEIRLLRKSKER